MQKQKILKFETYLSHKTGTARYEYTASSIELRYRQIGIVRIGIIFESAFRSKMCTNVTVHHGGRSTVADGGTGGI